MNNEIITSKKYLLENSDPYCLIDDDIETKNDCKYLYYQEFEIPPYQRPYSWKKENILTLLNDFYSAFKKSPSNDYYIGNVFCTPSSKQGTDTRFKQIIDGQQRVTTCFLILFYLSLRTRTENLNDDLQLKKYSEKIKGFRFNMSYPDYNIINEMRLHSNIDKIDIFFKNKKKAEKVSSFYYEQWKVFKNAWNQIKSFFDTSDKFPSLKDIEIFYKYISSHVFCLYIEDSPSTPIGHYLFSSLNGKGLKLDKIDLVKSFFVAPYMDNDFKIKKFNKLWGNLINDSENKLLTTISGYFKKNNKKQMTKDWLKNIEKTVKSPDQEFEKMCKWTHNMNPALKANTGKDKIDFWLLLFQNFNFSMFIPVYGHIRNLFSDEEFENNYNIQKQISNILSYGFKLNLLIVTLQQMKPLVFQNEIVDKVIDLITNQDLQNSKLKIDKAESFLREKLENELKSDYLQGLIKNFNPNSLSYSDAKDKKIIKFLLLLNPNNNDWYDFDKNEFIYQHANDLLRNKKTLDHKLHQSYQQYYEDDDKSKIVELYKYDKSSDSFIYDTKYINDDLLLYFDVNFSEYTQSEKFNNFKEKILHKIFNLRLMGANANSQRGNRCIYMESEIKKMLDVVNIKWLNDVIKKDFINFLGVAPKVSKNPSESWKTFISSADKIIAKNWSQYLNVKGSTITKCVSKYNIQPYSSISAILKQFLNNKEKIDILTWDLKVIEKSEGKSLKDLVDLRNVNEHDSDSIVELEPEEIKILKNIINKINKAYSM